MLVPNFLTYHFLYVSPLVTISLLEKAMATHSSTLAWKIPWMEEPGRLQSMGSLRVGHDWVTSLSLFLSCIGEGNSNPLQCSCLENPRNGGARWAAIYGVAQSQTGLKWLSSSSSPYSFQCFIWLPLVQPGLPRSRTYECWSTNATDEHSVWSCGTESPVQKAIP